MLRFVQQFPLIFLSLSSGHTYILLNHLGFFVCLFVCLFV
ncbi:rCG29086 [Rattus norvegicus]|uniref:RCG29086 n=1 Tax=Rattus norvegicus TaxID=10116 RepID=A6HUQ2_RAT|nr:rCG29086 [Rattus norvegicus]